MFILTKAISIYAIGAKKNDAIPHFFKSTTRNLILALRLELTNEEVLSQLQQLIENPVNFNELPQNELTQAGFNNIREIAAGELQSSLFITRCWQKASEMLPN